MGCSGRERAIKEFSLKVSMDKIEQILLHV